MLDVNCVDLAPAEWHDRAHSLSRGQSHAWTARQFRDHGKEIARRMRARVQNIELSEFFGSPGWIRTSDHPINSRMLYR